MQIKIYSIVTIINELEIVVQVSFSLSANAKLDLLRSYMYLPLIVNLIGVKTKL